MTSPEARPTLFLVAGPNGAGKTTFYETVLKTRVAAPFINADEIQRDELKDPSMRASYTASQMAADRREALIQKRESFVTETVFSHPSKLDLLAKARAAGFRIIVFHLDIVSGDLAVARVKARISEGGHPVPDDKVRERYARNKALIKRAALMADAAVIYDSSALNAAPRRLAKLVHGRLEWIEFNRPGWFDALYGDLLV
nr:zeta toxin family protein [Hyphomonas sp. Mor2]